MNPARFAVAIAAVSLALTGCSSSAATTAPTSQTRSVAITASPSASPPSASTTAPETATVTRTVSQPKTTVATKAPSTTAPSTTAAASPANCSNSQLSVRHTDAIGGDSNGGIVVIFTNISTRTCSLYGYPGAALVDKTGKQFLQARRDLQGMIASCNCSHPLRIRLARGKSASATLEGNNGGGDECLRGRTALVTAPNTTKSVPVPYTGSYSCDVQIHPVVAGTQGGNRH